jgi:hypothetical protein
MLAPNVHVTTTTTQPLMPATDLTGIDNYMEGLIQFAQAVEPGSARVIASVGDLYRQQRVSYIVLTSGINAQTGENEADAHYSFLTAMGIPADKIVLENRSTNTYFYSLSYVLE